MFIKGVRYCMPTSVMEMEQVVVMTNCAKNDIMQRGDYSPNMLAFGRRPRDLDNWLQEDPDGEEQCGPSRMVAGDQILERLVEIRSAAKRAAAEVEAKAAIRRGMTSRPRPVRGQDLKVGDACYIWRRPNKRQGCDKAYWSGPCTIAGFEGSNSVWVNQSGYLIKASPEQVRVATPEEELALENVETVLTRTQGNLKNANSNFSFYDLTKVMRDEEARLFGDQGREGAGADRQRRDPTEAKAQPKEDAESDEESDSRVLQDQKIPVRTAMRSLESRRKGDHRNTRGGKSLMTMFPRTRV